MGRPLFSTTIASPAPAVRVAEAPTPSYEKWSSWNSFDPDSEEFWRNVEYEAFLPPEATASNLPGMPMDPQDPLTRFVSQTLRGTRTGPIPWVSRVDVSEVGSTMPGPATEPSLIDSSASESSGSDASGSDAGSGDRASPGPEQVDPPPPASNLTERRPTLLVPEGSFAFSPEQESWAALLSPDGRPSPTRWIPRSPTPPSAPTPLAVEHEEQLPSPSPPQDWNMPPLVSLYPRGYLYEYTSSAPIPATPRPSHTVPAPSSFSPPPTMTPRYLRWGRDPAGTPSPVSRMSLSHIAPSPPAMRVQQ